MRHTGAPLLPGWLTIRRDAGPPGLESGVLGLAGPLDYIPPSPVSWNAVPWVPEPAQPASRDLEGRDERDHASAQSSNAKKWPVAAEIVA